MEYSIRELSELAGVSARTLRYYDEIGLLKPLRTSEAGYRFYGEKEVELLQQILFYRERGLELDQIAATLYNPEFDIRSALQEHLLELEQQRRRTDRLIANIKQTIASLEGEAEMSDKERFAAFKEELVAENERKYGSEIREKYGDEAVDASNRKMLGMSEEEYQEFEQLGKEIVVRLEEAVREKKPTDGAEANEIAALHKAWLMKTWNQYSKEAHIGLGQMYVADERFRNYYDKNVAGCAEFLKGAIEAYCTETTE